MRILIVSQYFYPEQFSNNAIAEAMLERGHQVDVLTCVPNYGRSGFYTNYSNKKKRFEFWRGIRIFRARTIARGASNVRLLLNYVFFPIAAIVEYHRRDISVPDVSFVSMPSPLTQALVGIYLKKRYRIPTVFWVQDIWPESPILTLGIKSSLIQRWLWRFCSWIYRQADVLLVQSPGFAARMEKSGVGYERIGVLPNTAPANYFPLPKPKYMNDLPFFELMFAGNIGESQDFETIVEAAKRLQHLNVRWTVIGSGRHETWLRDAVDRFGLSNRFLFEGRHPESKMPDFFARADAMLVSLKNEDIFELTVPYKIQCYLACGRPIIGSINGEAARIIERAGAGYVAQAGKPDQLAGVIERMVRLSDAEREAMGDSGRDFFVRNYASQKVYTALEESLMTAIDSSTNRRRLLDQISEN